MTVNLTCTQVSALLSFYIEDKLSSQLKQFVETHLDSCPLCRAKLEVLTNMVKSLKEAHAKISSPAQKETVRDPHYEEFKLNLSAYIDNELSNEESVKVKKYVISNPKARQELESMYNLKKVLHNSFEKAKHEAKEDYSKFILRKIDIQEEVYSVDSFSKVIAFFIAIFTVFSIALAIIFWV